LSDVLKSIETEQFSFVLEASLGFSSMLNLSYEAWDPHKTNLAIIWDINDECS